MEKTTLPLWDSEASRCQRSVEEEATLIRCITAGDESRFVDLIQPHLVALRRTVRTRVNNDEDVKDVVQETLLKTFKHLAQFHFASSFRTWLCSIAMNEACQMRRDARSWMLVNINELDCDRILTTRRLDSMEARFEQLESADLLRETIKALPEKYRVIVQYRDLSELSIAETARVLRLTCSAVKSRHHRARKLIGRDVIGSIATGGHRNPARRKT